MFSEYGVDRSWPLSPPPLPVPHAQMMQTSAFVAPDGEELASPRDQIDSADVDHEWCVDPHLQVPVPVSPSPEWSSYESTHVSTEASDEWVDYQPASAQTTQYQQESGATKGLQANEVPSQQCQTIRITPAADADLEADEGSFDHSDAPSHRAKVKVASRACVSCRRLKSSCDDVRPCLRCARVGRECIDRPEEEIRAARRRSKRPIQITTTEKTHPTHTDPNHSSKLGVHGDLNASLAADALPSTADLDALSMSLYSRTFLALTHDLGTRDSILRTHAQVMAMKPPISTLVEWHRQVAVLCLYLSEMLSQDDFLAFLTGGLTNEQLSSTNWLSSPLASWSKLSTRPLHFTFQPDTTRLEDHLQGVVATNEAATNDDSEPELRFEWLPSAHVSFQQWQNTLELRLMCERQLQETRESMLAGAYGTTDVPAGSAATVASPDDDTDGLTDRFISLGIGRALSARPPPTTPHDRISSVHARWCPLGDPNAHHGHEATKMKRTSDMECVHTVTSDDETSAPLHAGTDCVCFKSSPLPMRVLVNSEFKRLFGWRRIDVELGFQREGLRWHRRWVSDDTTQRSAHTDVLAFRIARRMVERSTNSTSRSLALFLSLSRSLVLSFSLPHSFRAFFFLQSPPSLWIPTHRLVLSQLEPSIGHLVHLDSSELSERRHRAESIAVEPLVCLTRTGANVTVATRTVHVIRSDGMQARSAIILTWRRLGETDPHPT